MTFKSGSTASNGLQSVLILAALALCACGATVQIENQPGVIEPDTVTVFSPDDEIEHVPANDDAGVDGSTVVSEQEGDQRKLLDIDALASADADELQRFWETLKSGCDGKCKPDKTETARMLDVLAERFAHPAPFFAMDGHTVPLRATNIACLLSPGPACENRNNRGLWMVERNLAVALRASPPRAELQPRPDLAPANKTRFDGRRTEAVFALGKTDETRLAVEGWSSRTIKKGDRINLRRLWSRLAKKASGDTTLAWSLRVVLQPVETGGGIIVIVSARPHINDEGPIRIASGYRLMDTGAGLTNLNAETALRSKSEQIFEAWMKLDTGGGEFFVESWR